MTDFARLLAALVQAEVRFILVGGVAATAHGSARLTQDVDIVYERSGTNINRLVDALRPLKPYLRGAPLGLPFRWDSRTIDRGLNFTLTTEAGDVDLLGFITGGGAFDDLRTHTQKVQLFGMEVLCLDLETLISVKRAAARPKDFEAIAQVQRGVSDDDGLDHAFPSF